MENSIEKDEEILNNIKAYMQENIDKGYHKFIYNDLGWDEKCIDVINAIQNLIARYKELEDKNKTLETLLQGSLYQMYLYYKELAGRYQANSISKDKVKEKKEELDKEEKRELKGTKGQDRYYIKQKYMYKRKVLQELLEESEE